MNIVKAKVSGIKNLPGIKINKDFNFNAFSYFVLGLFLIGGILIHILLQPHLEAELLIAVVVGAIWVDTGEVLKRRDFSSL